MFDIQYLIKEWLDTRVILYPCINHILKQSMKIVTVSVHRKWDRQVIYWHALVVSLTVFTLSIQIDRPKPDQTLQNMLWSGSAINAAHPTVFYPIIWQWRSIMVTCWSSVYPSICCKSIHPYFNLRMILWVNVNGFSSKLRCILIFWRSGLGLLIKFLTELPACHMIVARYYCFSLY